MNAQSLFHFRDYDFDNMVQCCNRNAVSTAIGVQTVVESGVCLVVKGGGGHGGQGSEIASVL